MKLKPLCAAIFWISSLGAMLSLAAPVTAGPLEDATAADDKGDYAAALQLLRPLAGQGNAQAQFKLGSMYDDGRGVHRAMRRR